MTHYGIDARADGERVVQIESAAHPIEEHVVTPGHYLPVGCFPDEDGVNFSLYSQRATRVVLMIFDTHDAKEAVHEIQLNPNLHRTYFFWHCHVSGLKAGEAHYAFRVYGPAHGGEQEKLLSYGQVFNGNKVLLDPHGFGHTTDLWDRGRACGPDDNLAQSMRTVVIDPKTYDWEGDEHPRHRMADTVVYEMHVKGFTASPTSGVDGGIRGRFLGLIEKIPYLKELGVTAVELLPVMSHDEQEGAGQGPSGTLSNYWGYSTVGFFAPHHEYCVNPAGGSHLDEFRDMVKAFHKAGIEVWMDVVFNHTSEGNHEGPTISFRGLANDTYYHLVPSDKRYYMDFSGCGNTVLCNHPVTSLFIRSCLEFWVRDMHIDGFRFDEGSVLTRDQGGAPMPYPPAVWNIELSDVLADTKIVAEVWDAGGLYQVGMFPGMRWGEWNGKFRDTARRFVRGDPGLVGDLAARIGGSADLYQPSGHLPTNSVNFVTCHDGFTLNDLVSYNHKDNWANGEGNRDGIDENLSWDCAGDEILRGMQIRNLAAVLLLSAGVPMISMGDEVRRTQRGNNNSYCQDNEISWLDWSFANDHADVLRFFREMIALRKGHPTLRRKTFFTGGAPCDDDDRAMRHGLMDVAWHGCQLDGPGWNDPDCQVLAYTLGALVNGDPHFHVMMNMGGGPLMFEVPRGQAWRRRVDTSIPSPHDIEPEGSEVPVSGDGYLVNGHSVVVLLAHPRGTPAAPTAEAPEPSQDMIETPEGATSPTHQP